MNRENPEMDEFLYYFIKNFDQVEHNCLRGFFIFLAKADYANRNSAHILQLPLIDDYYCLIYPEKAFKY